MRRARGRLYSAEVAGFRDQKGALWSTNTLAQVLDDFAGISDLMLVNSVAFSNSSESGEAKTVITLVEKGSYTLSLAEPLPAEKKVGGGLFG